MSEVEQARAFAILAHGDQRYGAHPYVKHLDDVAGICRWYLEGERFEVLAYLHDVLEDTTVTANEIHSEFGTAMQMWCVALTDCAGPDRRARKRATHQKLASLDATAFAEALAVKAADRLANVRACVENNHSMLGRYRSEHAEFRAAVYRPGLCDALWMELDGLIALVLP